MSHNRFLHFETLEERMLLSGTETDLQLIRSTWSHFDISSDIHVIEIESDDLSVQSLQNAINTASETEEDDLILVHTTNQDCKIEFTNSNDELMIDIDATSFGKISILSVGEQALTLDANDFSRLFCVKTGIVQLGNLVLTGGLATTDMEGESALSGLGGAIANTATLTLDKVIIDGNRADHGIYDETYSKLNSQGGGIYNAGFLTIINSTITNNCAASGEINLYERAAYGAGGGIFNHRNGTIILNNTVISHNEAESKILTYVPDPQLEGTPVEVTVEQNGQGGGVCNFGSLTVSGHSEISWNSARFGGGISSLYNKNPCSVTISDSRINDNHAFDSGGGLYTEPHCTVTLEHSFIQGNTAEANGGGITNLGVFSLIDSVLSGNCAGTNGGGLYSYGSYDSSLPVSLVQIVNSTITGNSSGTTDSGSGGGLYFMGIQSESGNTFATLEICNSIIVKNRVERAEHVGSDENLYNIGTCTGDHSLTTFSEWSTRDTINYLYDENVPLFVMDYSFTNKTEGDYQLVYDSQSQAIDTGNNEAAASVGLDANSLDLSGQPRLQRGTIDLGAYEFQPTPFDPAFPSRLSVQQGSSLNLRCEGTDQFGNPITKYYVDLDGDGKVDKEGSDLWISWNELSIQSGNKGYFWLMAENSLENKSEYKPVAVNITEVLPDIQVRQTHFYHDQIVILYINVHYYDRSVKQWVIDWGDGTEATIIDSRSSSLTEAHFYDSQNDSITYNITLSIVDTNDHGGDILYNIGSHTVIGNQKSGITDISSYPNAASPVACTLPEESRAWNNAPLEISIDNNSSSASMLLFDPDPTSSLIPEANLSGSTNQIVSMDSKTVQRFYSSEYEPLFTMQGQDTTMRFIALESIWNDDDEYFKGLNKTSSRINPDLTNSLENDVLSNDDFDVMLFPFT